MRENERSNFYSKLSYIASIIELISILMYFVTYTRGMNNVSFMCIIVCLISVLIRHLGEILSVRYFSLYDDIENLSADELDDLLDEIYDHVDKFTDDIENDNIYYL